MLSIRGEFTLIFFNNGIFGEFAVKNFYIFATELCIINWWSL